MRSFLEVAAAAAVLVHFGSAASLATFRTSVASASDVQAYEEFMQRYGRQVADEEEYSQRLALFLQRRAAVEAHNALPTASWRATINKFADYTPEEHSALYGYSRSGSSYASRTRAETGSSFLEVRPRLKLADKVDWRSKLNSSRFIREQGSCGSCWAVASVGALEMHAEIRGLHPQKLSYEQLVDCVPNPRNCGGQGGCKGATAELAFGYVAQHGLAAADHYHGYQSGGDGRCKQNDAPSIKIGSFERLPENKVLPLLEAVATKGPVVVSVDASGWSSYDSGVFADCPRNATVNHAVLLVGYGVDKEEGKKYWLIRNSWGSTWGENGFIRVLRHDSDEGKAGHCGMDHDPQQGVGCDGGPPEIPVCGMCGILSDSSYPKEVSVEKR